ncbi:hypothetical protein [Spirochaeta lutea]|nr:hypothetical protein [Spirochaeta lutea]
MSCRDKLRIVYYQGRLSSKSDAEIITYEETTMLEDLQAPIAELDQQITSTWRDL